MIDIHLHILPGVDDGPETMEESIFLAKALVQEGVHVAIATPHYNDLFPQRSVAEINDRVNELQQVLDIQSIPLRLFTGHEVLIKPGLIEDIQSGRVATLNGSRYLLLELWNNTWLPQTEKIIFELRSFEIIPIIAHPERSHLIQQNPAKLVALLQQGVLTQLTVGSLAGTWGKTIQHRAETLLNKGLVHCMASDAHSLHKRPPGIIRGLQHATKLIGQAEVKFLSEIFPGTILNNGVCIR